MPLYGIFEQDSRKFIFQDDFWGDQINFYDWAYPRQKSLLKLKTSNWQQHILWEYIIENTEIWVFLVLTHSSMEMAAE